MFIVKALYYYLKCVKDKCMYTSVQIKCSSSSKLMLEWFLKITSFLKTTKQSRSSILACVMQKLPCPDILNWIALHC